MANNQHDCIKTILKVVGVFLLLAGFVFTVIGFVDFFKALSNTEKPKLFWCMFLGLPLMGIGSGFSVFAFRREIATYAKEETLPVTENALSALSNALQGEKCECGQVNEDSAIFCSVCGKALKQTCKTCGKTLPVEDVYCSNCGNKL